MLATHPSWWSLRSQTGVFVCFLSFCPGREAALPGVCWPGRVNRTDTQTYKQLLRHMMSVAVCMVAVLPRRCCRCFLTLTQALALGYGGNPYGPAGTGKTESVKALGLALGRQVS